MMSWEASIKASSIVGFVWFALAEIVLMAI